MRIFIYSRKSKWTGRGESIENQVQMCRDYIESYVPGADLAEIRVFEDEGYSGKNVKRPEFQKMMAEIKKGRCSYLVCYKLDRLGRNIIDIAGLVEELNNLKVSFISIKENFDTSTPLGKTMLYIAGIFAQMEREQIAERVKDNMVMLAKSGRWLGGNTPLGFFSQKDEKIQINDKIKTSYRLAENPQEMITVRFIFREYLEKQSLAKVVEYFLRNGIQTKRGKEYTPTAVRDILSNPVYCMADEAAYGYFESMGCQMCFSKEEADGRHGIIAYAKTSSASYKNKDNPPEAWIIAMGKHKGEIPGAEFERVQKLLGANRQKGEACRKVRNEVALLSGILFCTCGHAMRPKYYSAKQVTNEGERKFSYLCPYKDATHSEKCSVENVPGNDLDFLVCRELFRHARPDWRVREMLDKLGNEFEKGEGYLAGKGDLQRQALEEKEQGIKNLLAAIKKPGRSEAFIAYADEEIAKLSKECEELKKHIKSGGDGEETPVREKCRADLLVGQLDSFEKAFQMLTVPKKREYLRMLLDQVVWDGEKAQIFLHGSR